MIEELGGNGAGVAVVTHSSGFREPFVTVMDAAERKKLIDCQATVLTATHALSGIKRWFNSKYQGTYPALIVADTLRLFGQGMKVAAEKSYPLEEAAAAPTAILIFSFIRQTKSELLLT